MNWDIRRERVREEKIERDRKDHFADPTDYFHDLTLSVLLLHIVINLFYIYIFICVHYRFVLNIVSQRV